MRILSSTFDPSPGGGFPVLPKDTSTYRQSEPGFKPETSQLPNDPLYKLSHSGPEISFFKPDMNQ